MKGLGAQKCIYLDFRQIYGNQQVNLAHHDLNPSLPKNIRRAVLDQTKDPSSPAFCSHGGKLATSRKRTNRKI